MTAMDDTGVSRPRSFRQLLDAVTTIGADLDLHTVLQHIVAAATSLADARYGALGILDPSGTHLTDFLTVGVDDETRATIGELPKGHGILGLLIIDPQPLRLPDLRAHPESYGFPPGHPSMRSFLGVPVMVRGEVFGNLYLTDKRSDEAFSEADEELLVGFATAAGIAIDNARLHASLSELALLQDRERIAMDLHDTVIQQLFAVGLSLQAMLRRVRDPDLAGRIETAVDDLDTTIKQIRTTIFDLDAPAQAAGLRDRLLALVAEVRHALPSVPGMVFDGPIEVAVDQATADELVVVLREALSNVARHAEASRIEVTLTADASTVTLTVEDDGVGPPAEAPGHGSGLRNLASRAERLGGRFELVRRPGGGACQRWSVPRRG
jgi:signal transduction histidine kinase